ncbi:hypothetical protein [Mucilaginibacter sp. CSA2-8R]|uniref:hypothetical protein n=1 Tax=Mucilaginibacter sp. CSA2-8R TaxID=3141542 RepID=UPI00315DDD0C
MDESFLLEIIYKGEQLKYDAQLRSRGYVHYYAVDLDGITVQFEPDEEGSYRALVTPEQLNDKTNKIDVGLLQALVKKLESLEG